MKKKYKKKKENEKLIAVERIRELFKQADKVFNKNPKLSNRYVQLARKISMKIKVRIPSPLKKRFCKHCYSYLKSGKNVRVRLQQGRQGKVVYKCLNCNKYMRFPYKTKKK